MITRHRPTLLAVAVMTLVITAGIRAAIVYVGPVTSPGAESAGSSIMNAGQAAIGRASDGTVTLHAGVVPIYALAHVAPGPGDCTENGLVNLNDYDLFEGCLLGPGGGLGANCGCADIDDDLDVDLRDAARLMRAFSAGS